jgi:hypothetical protein
MVCFPQLLFSILDLAEVVIMTLIFHWVWANEFFRDLEALNYLRL